MSIVAVWLGATSKYMLVVPGSLGSVKDMEVVVVVPPMATVLAVNALPSHPSRKVPAADEENEGDARFSTNCANTEITCVRLLMLEIAIEMSWPDVYVRRSK